MKKQSAITAYLFECCLQDNCYPHEIRAGNEATTHDKRCTTQSLKWNKSKRLIDQSALYMFNLM